MKKIIYLVLLILVVSCNKSESLGNFEEAASPANLSMDQSSNGSKEELNNEAYIVQNGNVRFETDEIDESKEMVDVLIEKYKAKLFNSTLSDYGRSKELDLEIKIPAKNFDGFLNELKSKVKDFESMSVGREDVTRQYVDYEARLKTQKALEQRLMELLNKAASVDEIIQVESQLAEVRGKIESMQGQFNVLKDQVKYSTLNIQIYENTYSQDTSNRFLDSLKNGWGAFVSFLFAVLWLWPFILLVLIIVFSVRLWKKKSKKN